MEQQSITVETRQGTGKSVTRKLRAAGKLPGVLYGLGNSKPVVVDPKVVHGFLMEEGGRNRVLTVQGSAGAGKHVLIKDYQVDPVSRRLVHVDLLEIDVAKKIVVTVPINFTGRAQGVADGGVLNIVARDIKVKCLPNAIPKHIDVDVTALKIGASIHLGEVTLPEGMEKGDHGDPTIVTCVPPTKEEEAAPSLTQAAEPEVITEKKAAEGEEGAEAKPGEAKAEAKGGDAKPEAKKDEKKK